jgi:hypothetical protein
MIGAFIQLNSDSRRAGSNPVGYVIQENGCWQWVGCTSADGYGSIYVKELYRSSQHMIPAHRHVYELHRGPIPGGLDLDHLCRNRGCVNPDHLEPVTNRENILRGESPMAKFARQTHCPKCGGEYSQGKTGRRCIPCVAANERKTRRESLAHHAAKMRAWRARNLEKARAADRERWKRRKSKRPRQPQLDTVVNLPVQP